MEIKTKYNIGDKVYIIVNNELFCKKIEGIYTLTYDDNYIEISYPFDLMKEIGRVQTINESLVFKDKIEIDQYLIEEEKFKLSIIEQGKNERKEQYKLAFGDFKKHIMGQFVNKSFGK